jgi:hypothetical protein
MTTADGGPRGASWSTGAFRDPVIVRQQLPDFSITDLTRVLRRAALTRPRRLTADKKAAPISR